MAVTISDILITSSAFVDINNASSISSTAIIDIQNKSDSTMILQIAAAQPSATSTDGYYILPNEKITFPGTATDNKWVRTSVRSGKLMVRDIA